MSQIIDLIIDIDGEPLQLTGNVDYEEIIGLGNGSNDTIHFKPLTGTEADIDKLATVSASQMPLEAVSSDFSHMQAMILDHEMALYRDVRMEFYRNSNRSRASLKSNSPELCVNAFRKYFNLDSEDT